jgi:hypothetical protein
MHNDLILGMRGISTNPNNIIKNILITRGGKQQAQPIQSPPIRVEVNSVALVVFGKELVEDLTVLHVAEDQTQRGD